MEQPPDATEAVTGLVVHSSFSKFTTKTLPSTEILEDVLLSPSALSDIIHSLATSAQTTDDSTTAIEQEILRTQITNVISFPEHLADFIGVHKGKEEGQGSRVPFDHQLYNQKLADAFWHLLLGISDNDSSENQTQAFAITFAAVAVRRGLGPVLFERFPLVASLIFAAGARRAEGSHFVSRLSTATAGILEGATNRRTVLRKTGAPTLRLTGSWTAWMQTLLAVGESNRESEGTIVTLFVNAITEIAVENSPAPNLRREAQQELQKYILSSAIAKLPTPRGNLRFIYTKILTAVQQQQDAQSLPALLERALNLVFAHWESGDLVATGDSASNESIFHSVMYALLFMKEAKLQSLPTSVLGPFLNGVTTRLQCVHAERQAYGMAAAAAFAAFFVESDEAATNFLQNADFSAHLQKWLSEETAQAVKLPPSVPSAGSPSPSSLESLFIRTEVLPSSITRALDPDAPHRFFSLRSLTEAQEAPLAVAPFHEQHTVVGFSSTSETLPAFGTQELDSDESNVAVLKTFRASYESLLGIGKGANRQMHETQQVIEAGLYGMAKSLAAMKRRLSESKDNVKFPSQLDPLVPSLLQVLLSLSIYAPEDKTKSLYGVRYSIVVDLVVLSTKIALHTLSSMIYGSNYGVYQRVEMARAVGDAAGTLASVQLRNAEPNLAEGQYHPESPLTGTKQKRVYPPIATPASPEKRSIILDEGKNTRRWGNAVQSRIHAKSRTRRYMNVLGEVAPFFVTALLARHDADHFRFFQDTEPYVPAEILRTLVAVFQGVAKIRHVAPTLCEQNIDFFIAVAMHHPHLAVRKQAWVAIGEVMRCWCGAPPALEATADSYTKKQAFSYSGSLMFGDAWLRMLEILHSLCVDLDRKKDPVFTVAALAVSTLRDLVFEQKDFDSMMSPQGGDIMAF